MTFSVKKQFYSHYYIPNRTRTFPFIKLNWKWKIKTQHLVRHFLKSEPYPFPYKDSIYIYSFLPKTLASLALLLLPPQPPIIIFHHFFFFLRGLFTNTWWTLVSLITKTLISSPLSSQGLSITRFASRLWISEQDGSESSPWRWSPAPDRVTASSVAWTRRWSRGRRPGRTSAPCCRTTRSFFTSPSRMSSSSWPMIEMKLSIGWSGPSDLLTHAFTGKKK